VAAEPQTTVIVVGAGASVAEALRHRPKRPADHPPLDRNFFAGVRKHALAGTLSRVERRAAELGEPDLCRRDAPVSLEEHLGRLFFEMQTTPNDANVRAYYDLVGLYCDDLLSTTNWMTERSGPMRKLVERELRRPARVSVITFNHDLLIENALSLIPSRSYGAVWCLRHAYGFGDEVRTCSNNQPLFDYECPGSAHQHVPIFKLHGSVNWVFRTVKAHPPADVARRKREIFVWHNRTLPEHNRKLTGPQRNWYLWSLIVPPIYEKHSMIRAELNRIWTAAAENLRAADRVIFWGYSFPRADLHARYWFQRGSEANEALRRPILINPDPSAHSELCSILKPRRVDHYTDVDVFLRT
jgi:hypothetical protein